MCCCMMLHIILCLSIWRACSLGVLPSHKASTLAINMVFDRLTDVKCVLGVRCNVVQKQPNTSFRVGVHAATSSFIIREFIVQISLNYKITVI